MKKILIFLNLMLLVSCSSLPKKAVENNPVKNEANQLYQKALSMEKSKNHQTSAYYYDLAINKYALTDDREGVLKAKTGLAKQQLALLNLSLFNKTLNETRNEAIILKNTYVINECNLLKLQYHYQNSQYDSMAVILDKMRDNRPEQLMRKYAWRSQMNIKTGKIDQEHLQKTEDFADNLLKQYQKNKYQGLPALSFAYYSLGLSYYELKKFDKSLSLFQKAYQIDLLDQNFYNLGIDLYFIGLNLQTKSDLQNANHNFSRSMEIFYQLNENQHYYKAKYHYLDTQYALSQDQSLIQNMINLKNNTEDKNLQLQIENWLKDK